MNNYRARENKSSMVYIFMLREDVVSQDRRRRKSITLFEMKFDTVENEMLESLRQRTLADDSEEEESEIKLI